MYRVRDCINLLFTTYHTNHLIYHTKSTSMKIKITSTCREKSKLSIDTIFFGKKNRLTLHFRCQTMVKLSNGSPVKFVKTAIRGLSGQPSVCCVSTADGDRICFFFFSVTNHASEKEKDYVSAKVLEELDPSSDSECTSGSHNPGTDSLSGRIGTEQQAKSQPTAAFSEVLSG